VIWILSSFAVVLFALSFFPALNLIWPMRQNPEKRFELGMSLFTFAAGAFLSLTLQIQTVNADLTRREEARSNAQMREAEARSNDERRALDFIYSQRNLSYINLRQVSLAHSYFRGKILDSADLTNADLENATFVDTSLRRARLRQANLFRLRAINTSFEGAVITDAELSEARLAGTNLAEAVLRGADLSQADLSHADARNINLTNADLSGANLTSADLTNAELQGANLQDTKGLEQAKLTNIRYDGETRWPAGFTPPPSAP
jgi:uncharacterized protein YjbI with pentapeptide repeats